MDLLKSAVSRFGTACDVRYFSLDYIDDMGIKVFECLVDSLYVTALVGKWVFAAAAKATFALYSTLCFLRT